MKQYYCHYTDDEGAEKIFRSGRIQASLKSSGDAASGNGVYLTKLMPRSSTRAQVAQNNWLTADDQSLRKTKNLFVLEIPDNKVEDVSTNDRNIFLFGGIKDLRLVKYRWYLQDFDTGKILASYRYHIESTGPVTAAFKGLHFPRHNYKFNQDYVMTEKTIHGFPVYKLKTGRFNRAKVRLFGRLAPEHHVKYLFMERLGRWIVGRNTDGDHGFLYQKDKYSLGPGAAGAWEYAVRVADGKAWCWKGDDPTLKAYPWYACSSSEWKTANTLVTPLTPAATTALTTVTTSSPVTSSASTTTASNPATTAISLATPAATISSTMAISPLPSPLVKPPPLSPTHLPSSPTPLNLPSPTPRNPPSPDTMKRSMSPQSLPAESSQDGMGLHSQDQSARMISLISQIPSGRTPEDSAPGTPGGSNYNTSEGASPQSSTPVASTLVAAPSAPTPAVKPVEEKGPSGGQTIKQITLKSHHHSLKERQSEIQPYARADSTTVNTEDPSDQTTAFSDDINSPDGPVGLPVSSQLGEMATEFQDEVMQLLPSFQEQESQDRRMIENARQILRDAIQYRKNLDDVKEQYAARLGKVSKAWSLKN